MKRLLATFVVVAGCTLTACAEAQAPLTDLRAIGTLTYDQANQRLPVAFEATVTYYRPYEHTLFVQDQGVALYVHATTDAKLSPGDRVLVRGATHGSFRPNVYSSNVTLLNHGVVPQPLLVTFDQAIRGQTDCMLVTLRGVVRAANLEGSLSAPVYYTNLQILMDGGYIAATMDSNDVNAPQELLDSNVEVTGVLSGQFDGKMQQTGILLHVQGLDDIKILKHAPASPWELPLTPMQQVLHSSHVQDSTQRVRVQGTVTYFQPGSELVLQSGSKSLQITTESYSPLQLGDLVDASGFPDVRDGFLTLTRAVVHDTNVQAPVAPIAANWQKLASSGNIFDLVSIEGSLLMEAREATQDEYVVVSDGHLFSAIYRHANAARQLSLPPMKEVPLGSRVRVTGICSPESSNPFNGLVPFNILARTPDDVTVIASPSLLNVRNLLFLVGLLLAVVVAAGVRGWAIEHRTRRQTTELAYIEQRRSRILEDINGARPLAEIVEQITELVSYKLRGAPSWCQIADGAQLGNCPAKLTDLRIVKHEIRARSGAQLGMMMAGFDPNTEPTAIETEALSMAVALTALAIETRRLYSDLIHRSEFDLLTDIHNRFSLEKHLEHQIIVARETAGIFGLIYIDLDRFKQINDSYGHHVGDIYLQEAAMRMKRQLRPHDKLARLGGDEFAALVTVVRNRTDIEEIALRLERCFDEPFVLEQYTLHGAASVGIALFPEDAVTVDALLNAADAIMYTAKYEKRHDEEMATGR